MCCFPKKKKKNNISQNFTNAFRAATSLWLQITKNIYSAFAEIHQRLPSLPRWNIRGTNIPLRLSTQNKSILRIFCHLICEYFFANKINFEFKFVQCTKFCAHIYIMYYKYIYMDPPDIIRKVALCPNHINKLWRCYNFFCCESWWILGWAKEWNTSKAIGLNKTKTDVFFYPFYVLHLIFFFRFTKTHNMGTVDCD